MRLIKQEGFLLLESVFSLVLGSVLIAATASLIYLFSLTNVASLTNTYNQQKALITAEQIEEYISSTQWNIALGQASISYISPSHITFNTQHEIEILQNGTDIHLIDNEASTNSFLVLENATISFSYLDENNAVTNAIPEIKFIQITITHSTPGNAYLTINKTIALRRNRP